MMLDLPPAFIIEKFQLDAFLPKEKIRLTKNWFIE